MNDSPENAAIGRASEVVSRATLAQRKDTAKTVGGRCSPGRLMKMTEGALERAGKAIADVLKLVPPPRPIACKANCPWCCHIRLTASPPEALLVLEYIRGNFSDGEIEALRRKVANIDGHTRGLGGDARARLRLPCPLLKDGSCSVHPVRPLSCRAVVSVDVEACKRAYGTRMEEPVPQHALQAQAANGVGYGLYAGLVDGGFEVEDVEMNAALALGLDDKEIAKRWLKGEPVFAAAVEVETP